MDTQIKDLIPCKETREKEQKTTDLDALDPRKHIIIHRARVNNLKNLSLAIPRHRLVVITGLSGSGKTSLAFDTLFAEGQRRYVESLSTYARQFVARMQKPAVDHIYGISPAVAIDQKARTYNPRSTVGTLSEVYEYLKLLYARIGEIYSPISGQRVQRHRVKDVLALLSSCTQKARFMVTAPLEQHTGRDFESLRRMLLAKGYTRLVYKDTVKAIEEIENIENMGDLSHLPLKANGSASTTSADPPVEDAWRTWHLLIDRGQTPLSEGQKQRMADSIQTAFYEGNGSCCIRFVAQDTKSEGPAGTEHHFSDRLESDGMVFKAPNVHLFSFNSPYGACSRCEGFGQILGLDERLVIPDINLSVAQGAIAPWRTESMRHRWLAPLLQAAPDLKFPIHRPYHDLSDKQQALLWEGTKEFKGIRNFFDYMEGRRHKIQSRVLLAKYQGRTPCPDCQGSRLRKEASYVKIGGYSLSELLLWPLAKLHEFFKSLSLRDYQRRVASFLLQEIENRLAYLCHVGLSYLTLHRSVRTLSGGEYQRIRLATFLGSPLVGSIYILDEPSIGLHPRDVEKLAQVMRSLCAKGNTVLVVEHEEHIMRAADQIIDIGPGAGIHGGHLVFQGPASALAKHPTSYTGSFLRDENILQVPASRRTWKQAVHIRGIRTHNLKNVEVTFPLAVLTVVTGVSGSGKSTLVHEVLYPALAARLDLSVDRKSPYVLEGDYETIQAIELVDQQPIGRSSRANPATYVKAYDVIRKLFARQPLAQQQGFDAGHFSFNTDGGRCEACQGEGETLVEMQFMADIRMPCELCKGKRFKTEILEVCYQEKNIAEVLALSIEEALTFFKDQAAIMTRLQPLYEVGLGYIGLGQSLSSLSGGEAQRVKLASFLYRREHAAKHHTVFIFDEPTTGLHAYDIQKLMHAIAALVDQGHTAIIVEHAMEVVKMADWVIDLGPEEGDRGGEICFAGRPEDLAAVAHNHTAKYLKERLSNGNTKKPVKLKRKPAKKTRTQDTG